MSGIFRKFKKMSHRRKLVNAVGIVMLLFTGIWVATMHIAPENDVEKYKKELIAKGEKLEISEVLPPAVPPEQNGADVVNEAVKLIVGVSANMTGLPNANGEVPTNEPLAMRLIGPGRAIVCFEQPDVRADYFTNSWLNVLAVAEANRPAAETLERVMNYPALDFHLDYTNGFEMDMSCLDSVFRSAMLLSDAAICNLHDRNTAMAATSICVLLALVKGEESELEVGAPEIRRLTCLTAMEANWEVLQSSNVNEADLAMLQRSWERLEFFHVAENEILMNRADEEQVIQKTRSSSELLNQFAGIPITPISAPPAYPGAPSAPTTLSDDLRGFWYRAQATCAKAMWRASWTYSDELQLLQNYQITVDTVRTIETNGFINPFYTNMLNQLYGRPFRTPSRGFLRLDIPDLRHVFSEDSKAYSIETILPAIDCEVTKRMVVTAIALKRYQLKYGNYPTNLDSLVPEFVHAVPLDPSDGKPLRYRQNGDETFLLYSIGFSGVDNGGISSYEAGDNWLDSNLDWVWPQPATKAEIEYFYAHPPPK